MTRVADFSALSDIGLQRKTNEDAVVAAPPLFAVCDGMGGALAGEVASGLAAEVLAASITEGLDLRVAVERANAAVFAKSHGDSAHAGMGTTLTAALLEDGFARIVHVGDSRAYLLRGGELTQVSSDHSMVAELVKAGRLTAAEAASHPHKSVLTRALGTEPEAQLDEYTIDVLPGDVLLLCSDGLSGPVPAEAIARCLALPNAEDAAQKLIREARRRGGPDNISAVVVRFAHEAGAAETSSAAATAVELEEGADTGELEPLPADDGELPESPPRRRRWLGWLAVALAVLTAAGLAAAVILSSVFFISVDGSRLAVYSGLPTAVGPVPLHAVYRTSTRTYSSLTAAEQARVDAEVLQGRGAVMESARELEMWP